MTTLTPPQGYAVEVVALRKRRLDDARRAAERALRVAIAEQVAPIRADYELAVVEADRMGVPKAQIARAVGTTNPKPIREILNRAEKARRSTLSNRYSRDARPNVLIVELDGEDLDRACKESGWAVAEAVNAGVNRAEFRVTDGRTLVSETASFVSDAGRLHPVVAFVRSEGQAEALAWWAET